MIQRSYVVLASGELFAFIDYAILAKRNLFQFDKRLNQLQRIASFEVLLAHFQSEDYKSNITAILNKSALVFFLTILS